MGFLKKLFGRNASDRFTIDSEGVISDSQTGLQWLVGPDDSPAYDQAAFWVSSCRIGGGGWRMPTRSELRGLYAKGVGTGNMDPVFKTTGWWVWAELRDSSSAWVFNFDDGHEYWYLHGLHFSDSRVFGVRSPSR